MLTCRLDFETRSHANLLSIGAYNYARHPTTQIVCLSWALEDEPSTLWHRALPGAHLAESPRPDRLFALLDDESVVFEAHNWLFEWCIWNFVGRRLHGWPTLPASRMMCSAAKAQRRALPRSLEEVCKALELSDVKDMDGSKAMKAISKPDKEGNWVERADLLQKTFSYNRDDVKAEMGVSRACGPLPPREEQIFRLDQRINLRGVRIDREGVKHALDIAAARQKEINAELSALTGGVVPTAGRRNDMLRWLEDRGCPLLNTQSQTIDFALEDPFLPPDVVSALKLFREGNRRSVTKYTTMTRRWDSVGRVRDWAIYHGAAHGRWTSMGLQLQNMPRGKIKDRMEEAWAAIHRRDIAWIVENYGNVLDFLSWAIRGAICADEGKAFLDGDFAQIEARGTMWLAGQEEALQLFRNQDSGEGVDIYRHMAGRIYACSPEDVEPESHERQLGKHTVLGCGYQMWVDRFIELCRSFGIVIDEELAYTCVRAYRKEFYRVPVLWKSMNEAAISAIDNPKQFYGVSDNKVIFNRDGDWLMMQIPSKRKIYFHKPSVVWGYPLWCLEARALVPQLEKLLASGTLDTDSDYERVSKALSEAREKASAPKRPQIAYKGRDQKTGRWVPQRAYGGKLTEYAVSGMSRDILAEAMLRLEANGYPVVLHAHDEAVVETYPEFANPDEFRDIMAEQPAWCPGLPIKVGTWEGLRYRK